MHENNLNNDFSRGDLEKLDLLMDLLSTTPAHQLRQSIHEIYHTYLIQNHEMLPLDFIKVATNMYHFFDFLDRLETTIPIKMDN